MLDQFSKTRFIDMVQHRTSASSTFLWLLQVVIVSIFTALLIRYSLTPKAPIFIITNANASELNSKDFTLHHNGSSIRSTSYIINIEISNPNKRMGIYFNEIHLSIHHGGSPLDQTTLPGFYQGFKKTTLHEVEFHTDHQQVARGLFTGAETLLFNLETAIKYKIFRSKTKHHKIDLEADVPIGSDGRTVDSMQIKLHHRHL